MKKYLSLLSLVALLLLSFGLKAQLVANAGHDTTVCAASNVTIGGHPTASFGTGSCTYYWNPPTYLNSTSTANPTGLMQSTTTYTLRVVDSLGATAYDTVTVFVTARPVLDSLSVTDISCNGGSNGMVTIHLSGGILPYQYAINGGSYQSSPVFTGLDSNTYIFTYIDSAASCIQSQSFTVNPPLLLQVTNIFASNNSSCLNTSTICLQVHGGINSYSYAWSNSHYLGTGNCIYQLYADTVYTVTVTDGNGCTATASASVTIPPISPLTQCVWPGDADFSGLVDNNDLLPIGLAYGTTGYQRGTATLDYIPQYCQNWTLSQPDSANYKHIDCDGNGIVNADDTVAIMLNFGLSHPRSGGLGEWRAGIPALTARIVQDTVLNGDTLLVALELGGDSGMVINNAYGLAFTLNYDPIPVDTSQTKVTFGDSWFGNSTDKISIVKDLRRTGELKCALTRINHVSRSGGGTIGTAMFIITTDNINGKDYMYYKMNAWITDVTLIDSVGNPIELNAGNDSTLVGFLPTGINDPVDISAMIQVYPNPAKDQLVINSRQLAITEIKITNVMGQAVLQQPSLYTQHAVTDVSQLSAGVYFVSVTTNKGTSTQRLVISK